MSYQKIKSNYKTEEEAREICGDDIIDSVLLENCEFTNRVIDECSEVEEMSAVIEDDNYRVTVLYLVDKSDLKNCDGDLGMLDYTNYTFEISELN